MVEIDVEAFKKDGFSYEEIESIKRGVLDIKKGNTVSYNTVKKESRKKIFAKQKSYV